MKTTFAKTIVLALSAASVSTVALAVVSPAQAATLVPFSFQTNVTTSPATDPTRGIRLNSVTFGGNSISQFELVKEARILQNDTYRLDDGSLLGVLNSGRGPHTSSDPLVNEGPSKPNSTGRTIEL